MMYMWRGSAALPESANCMWHLPQAPTLLFHSCLSGLLMWQHGGDECASALTRCHGRPHHKEHPHRNPLQRRRQQAAAFQDGVHHFVLKGNQHEDEHRVEHGEPGGREVERHLGERGEVKLGIKQQSMKTTASVSAFQHSSPRACVHRSVHEWVCGLWAWYCFGTPRWSKLNIMQWKIFIQFTEKRVAAKPINY